MVLNWCLFCSRAFQLCKYFLRLSEYQETHIVWAHRITLIIDCLACTVLYCNKGSGLCRPIPLKSYLQGSSKIAKYDRHPVSAIVTLCFILLIGIMQLCIEMKRKRDNKKDAVIALMAINAERNLMVVRLKLQQQNTDSINLDW